ncbi:MAG: DUF177 domain-containing protein [Limnochordaceae bacterium]|nr:DUF177 domain-containing protein [Limnochordaceae bacterium]
MNPVSSLTVDVGRIRDVVGASLSFAVRAPAAELLADRADLHWRGEVEAAGQVINEEEILHVVGSVQAQAEALCARCLAPVPVTLVSPLDEEYRSSRAAGSPFPGKTRNFDGEVRSYRGDELDLTEPAVEAIWVAVPLRTLCRPDCRGLCLQCGKNLNEDSCACQPPTSGVGVWQAALLEWEHRKRGE